MALVDGTKWLFAQTLRKMLLSRTLHQIRITELCTSCGADRQTFYYHFKDKYDLVAWIYEQTFQNILRASRGFFGQKEVQQLLLAMQDDQSFYKKVFDDHSQNALFSYIQRVNRTYTRNALLLKENSETLSKEMEFALRFASHAWMHCLRDWISEDHGISAEQYAKLMCENTARLLPLGTVTIYENEE